MSKSKSDLAHGIHEARTHVFRQIFHGRHEQDRWDAYVWWLEWGDDRVVDPAPHDPSKKGPHARK
jgi:hypothetical protein